MCFHPVTHATSLGTGALRSFGQSGQSANDPIADIPFGRQSPANLEDCMRTEPVEIYSDTTNAAIMRHPGRKFPGVLIQGDTLYSFSQMAADALVDAEPDSDQWYVLKELAEALQSRVDLYAQVLREHDLELPFSAEVNDR
ncbi:hypothetical protein OK349_09150 [Sphingomonas sp. BT-65]|uniref:DUF6959 family protein n=1 Tax=Sphingomonas sp. BT-65 TaxID=2989821 RepID=UPI0022366549|nr:hypothetical protein [Sphingomonas sp. BT-65]MCW4461877.1 hypothetical protein [Sphingomonas sp. BT-65]